MISSPRFSRRKILVGVGGVAVLSATAGLAALTQRRGQSLGPTVTVTPRPSSTPAPTSTPVAAMFSSRAITDAMSHPEQWQQDNLPGQSSRVLDNGAYTVSVSKRPTGTGFLSWGDWVPPRGLRMPQFLTDVEMRLVGDPVGTAGGILFLYNYIGKSELQQFLTFLVRGDGRFSVVQQLPGGAGNSVTRIDWAPHPAIQTTRDATNLLRVEVRAGNFGCYVNNQPMTLNQPVPAEVAGFSALSFAADVLTASVEPGASAVFRNLRYEPLS